MLSFDAKIARALRGRDDHARGEGLEDDPVQNDWNGSAGALMSIVRSVEGWKRLADMTGSEEARQVAEELAMSRRDLEKQFPDAWRFVRPGFGTAASSS